MLTIHKILKKKINEIYVWLDLDDDDIKAILNAVNSNKTINQEIIIQVYDIHTNCFASRMDEDRITTTIYEFRNRPEPASILKCIFCKAPFSNNHSTIQFIPYRI